MPQKRIHDRPILRWIALHRVVTTTQALERHFLSRGRGTSYGARVLQRLERDGLISSQPLEPNAGHATRRVLSLTRAGYEALGMKSRVERDRKMPYYLREYRIQLAEVLHVRQVEGWRIATPQEAPALVRAWSLRPYRNRMLNDTEIVVRERLERQQIGRLPMRILVRETTGDIRFLLPVRPRFSPDNALRKMPNAGLWPRVEFDLVCSDMLRLERASTAVQRWAKRARANVSVHRVDHHRTRHIVRKKRKAMG